MLHLAVNDSLRSQIWKNIPSALLCLCSFSTSDLCNLCDHLLINKTAFFLFFSSSLSPVRELKMPSKMYSASLHPDKTTIVAGGEDLKVYKFDYATGEQLGE